MAHEHDHYRSIEPAPETTHYPSAAEKIAATARPFGDRVIVRQVAAPDRVGLIFTPGAPEVPPVGVVVAHGSGRMSDGTTAPREFEVGDRVLFQRRTDSDLEYAADQLAIPKTDKERLLMLRYSDILAVLDAEVVIGAGRRYL